MSFRNLIELDLVAEWIHHVRAPPAGDRIGVFEARTGGAELRHGGVEIIDAQREMSPRVKAELTVCREMDVTGRGRIPNARAVAKRDGPLQFLEAEGVSVELSSSGFLARRIEHLGVMQGNPHKFESRRAKFRCFPQFRGLSFNQRDGGADLAIEQSPMTTETPLVSLTPKATDKLREVLSKQDRQDLALRVYVTPGGCSGFSYGMTFADSTEDDDAIIEHDGVRVVVDPMSAMYLKGSEIDFVDALMGGGFALRNPNAVSSCGCGQSFKTADQSGTAKACAH